MSNKEFAEELVRLIEHHKHTTCDGETGPVSRGYALAHEHIIELIQLEASYTT